MTTVSKMRFKFDLTESTVSANLIKQTEDHEGNTEESVIDSRQFNVADYPEALLDGETTKSLVSYGLSKLLQDRSSSVNMEDKLEEMDNISAMLKSGVWRERKAPAAPKATIAPIFAEAVQRVYAEKGKDLSLTEVSAALAAKTPEERKAIKQLPAVGAMMDRLKQEAAETNLDDILSEL